MIMASAADPVGSGFVQSFAQGEAAEGRRAPDNERVSPFADLRNLIQRLRLGDRLPGCAPQLAHS